MIQMNGEVLSLIDQTAQKTAEKVTAELKRKNLIVEGKQTPFQKTETLLFNYPNFIEVIRTKEEQIEEIRKYGLRQKSSSVTSFSGGDGFIEVETDLEKVETKIQAIQDSISVTRGFVDIIDEAIETLADDKYFDLIRLRYFEGYSREDLAEYFDCDVKTVTRNKNRLINLLQIHLFSDEVIQRIFAF